MQLIGRLRSLLASREVRFLIVGGANTVVALGLFALFHHLLSGRTHYLVPLVLTYAVGIVIAFTSQRLLVFRVEGDLLRDFGRFVLVQAGSFATNAAALALLVEVLGLPVLPAQAISVALMVVVTYFGHLMFTFRREVTP